jgi:hypothetical protein
MRDKLDRPTELPNNLDADRLAEAALALLSLTLHDGRVWKALDWNLINILFEKGWIFDPASKAKFVLLTEEGEQLARSFLLKHFGLRLPTARSRRRPPLTNPGIRPRSTSQSDRPEDPGGHAYEHEKDE